jgi:E3 ubiquitin-protein ligase SIAH1
VYSCFTGHHQISTLDPVRCSTLADGLPKDVFCIVPKASGGVHDVVLKTTIDEARRYHIELGDEDDEDESYDEEEEEEDDDSDDDDDEEEDDSDDDLVRSIQGPAHILRVL